MSRYIKEHHLLLWIRDAIKDYYSLRSIAYVISSQTDFNSELSSTRLHALSFVMMRAPLLELSMIPEKFWRKMQKIIK